MKFRFRVKIKHQDTKTLLFNRKVKASNFVGAINQAISIMTEKGKLARTKERSMKVGGHWWMWARANKLEVTVTRLKVLSPKGMK